MKKIKTIPTIVGLIILVSGFISGLFLINKVSSWLTKAEPGIIPKQVKITNITDTGFTVSWITDSQTSGFIKYGTDKSLSFIAMDDRDQISGKTENFLTHHITLRNLKPVTTYFFKLISGGKTFDNSGEAYQVSTAPSIQASTPPNDVAYGTVLTQEGTPAEGLIVYLSLPAATPLSTLTKASGSWVIPLNVARSLDLSSYISYDKEATVEEIFVQGGVLGTASAITTTKYDSPVPVITLGGDFDFRKGQLETTPTPPTSLVSPKSKFSFGEISQPATGGELTILNPSENEKINTQKPEIIGTGPGGQSLTIEIESPTTISGQLTIGSDGNWRWTPPSELSPGEHTLTVSLPDGTKVVRRFTVLASGELPSFTASPSATLTPAISPTATPTSSPTPTQIFTPTPTPTPLPQVSKPGNLTPTILTFIMGGGMILLGLFAKILFRKI